MYVLLLAAANLGDLSLLVRTAHQGHNGDTQDAAGLWLTLSLWATHWASIRARLCNGHCSGGPAPDPHRARQRLHMAHQGAPTSPYYPMTVTSAGLTAALPGALRSVTGATTGPASGSYSGLRKISTCSMGPTLGSARPLDLDQLGYGASAMTVTCGLRKISTCTTILIQRSIGRAGWS